MSKIHKLLEKHGLSSSEDFIKCSEIIIKECLNIFEPPEINDQAWSYDKMMLFMETQDRIRQHFERDDL